MKKIDKQNADEILSLFVAQDPHIKKINANKGWLYEPFNATVENDKKVCATDMHVMVLLPANVTDQQKMDRGA